MINENDLAVGNVQLLLQEKKIMIVSLNRRQLSFISKPLYVSEGNDNDRHF